MNILKCQLQDISRLLYFFPGAFLFKIPFKLNGKNSRPLPLAGFWSWRKLVFHMKKPSPRKMKWLLGSDNEDLWLQSKYGQLDDASFQFWKFSLQILVSQPCSWWYFILYMVEINVYCHLYMSYKRFGTEYGDNIVASERVLISELDCNH